MPKLRIRGTLVMLFFFATVAVFPSVVQALASTKSTHRAASELKDIGVLTADGTDPVPVPIPWPSAVA